MSLPSEYTFGYVVARVVQSVADGSDSDRFPDMLAGGGTVTFKPQQKNRKTFDYSALVLNQNIKGTFYVPEPYESPGNYKHPPGTLIDPMGEVGVWLVTGTYRAEFSLHNGTWPAFDFTVTEENDYDNPLDLVHAAPPEPPPGVAMVVATIPPGGREDQTLVRDEHGQLTWQDILDDETAQRSEQAAIESKYYMEISQQNATKIPRVFVQDVAPESPDEGDLWLDTSMPEVL